MTFLLALLPAFLLIGLFSGSGSDPDDMDMMGDERAEDGHHDGVDTLVTDRSDDAVVGEDTVWGQSDDDELHHDGGIVTAASGDGPTFVTDFNVQTDVLDIELEHGAAGGALAVEAFGAGADAAITLNGVAIVVLVGVSAASVDLSRVSVRREA